MIVPSLTTQTIQLDAVGGLALDAHLALELLSDVSETSVHTQLELYTRGISVAQSSYLRSSFTRYPSCSCNTLPNM